MGNIKYIDDHDVVTATISTNYPKKISKLSVRDETSTGHVAFASWPNDTNYDIPAASTIETLFNAQVGGTAGGTATTKWITLSPHYCCRGNPPFYKSFYHNAMSRMELDKGGLSHRFITMIPMEKANGENILQRASFLLEQEVVMTFHFQQDEMDENIGDNDMTPAVIRGELRPAETNNAIGYGPKTVFYF